MERISTAAVIISRKAQLQAAEASKKSESALDEAKRAVARCELIIEQAQTMLGAATRAINEFKPDLSGTEKRITEAALQAARELIDSQKRTEPAAPRKAKNGKDGVDGRSVADVEIRIVKTGKRGIARPHLFCIMSDKTEIDAGELPIPHGSRSTVIQGQRQLSYRKETSATSVLETDDILVIDASAGDVAVQLPPLGVNSRSRTLFIKRINATGGNVVVNASGGDTITDYGSSATINVNRYTMRLNATSDGWIET